MPELTKPPPDHPANLAASAPYSSTPYGHWVLAATILGSSMAFIDGTVVNVALPVLQSVLGATVSQVHWVVECYALFLAALLLVGGSLGDLYGRRKIFGLGVILFAAASLWCGLAADLGQLIAARGLQGIGGALLVPGSLTLIMTNNRILFLAFIRNLLSTSLSEQRLGFRIKARFEGCGSRSD